MAAVAEQPPPPCFFSLSSSPLSCSTAAPTTVSHCCFPPLSTSPRNRSNRSPILPSMRYDGHAGTPLFNIQLTPFLSHFSCTLLSTFPPLPLHIQVSAIAFPGLRDVILERFVRTIHIFVYPCRRHIPYLRRISTCALAAIKVRSVTGKLWHPALSILYTTVSSRWRRRRRYKGGSQRELILM